MGDKAVAKFPDGKGGWVEMEGERISGSSANADKQAAVLQRDFIQRSADLMERVWKFTRMQATDAGLDEGEMAFAVALLSINMREHYPPRLGGTAKFDEIARNAADYFDANS